MSQAQLSPSSARQSAKDSAFARALPGLLAAFSGLIFGLGLIIGGMTDPSKVIGFLDFAGDWEPALAFVMAGGVGVHFLLSQFVLKRKSPLFDQVFHLPTKRDLDAKLLFGAAIFGAGWGLAGYCPGPGIVGGGAGSESAIIFVATLIIGMVIQHGVFEPRPQRTSTPC